MALASFTMYYRGMLYQIENECSKLVGQSTALIYFHRCPLSIFISIVSWIRSNLVVDVGHVLLVAGVADVAQLGRVARRQQDVVADQRLALARHLVALQVHLVGAVACRVGTVSCYM